MTLGVRGHLEAQSGCTGKFGLVIGVARKGRSYDEFVRTSSEMALRELVDLTLLHVCFAGNRTMSCQNPLGCSSAIRITDGSVVLRGR